MLQPAAGRCRGRGSRAARSGCSAPSCAATATKPDPGTPSGSWCAASCSSSPLAASTSIGPWPLSKVTVPLSGVTARIRILLTVVLPQPLSPTRPRHSPRRMSKLTPSTARTGASLLLPNQPDLRVVKDFVRSRTDSRMSGFLSLGRGLLAEQRAGVDRNVAQRLQPLAGLHVEMRHRRHQALEIGMARPPEDRLDRSGLHDLAVIDDHHLVGDVGDDAEIVGDQQHRHVELGLQIAQQLQDLRLDGDVERRRRLVGDQQRRAADQRHGDHRALAHAARKLERIHVDRRASDWESRRGRASRRSRSRRSALVAVVWIFSDLADLVADRVQRRQRGHRLLEDLADAAAAQCPDFRVRRAAASRCRWCAQDASDRRTGCCPVTLAERGRMPMTAWLMTDLPEPDSPTSAVTLPGRMRRLARLTAWIRPPSIAKVMLRSSIRNRSAPEVMPSVVPPRARFSRARPTRSVARH